jgi:lactate dehydrogenase-like 2-hydroxyacid dehydrogenase
MSPHILIIGENVEQHEAHFATRFTVHKLSDKPDRDAYIAEVGDKIEALCLSGGANPRGDKRLLDRLPNLSLAATFGVGVAPGGGILDTEEALRRGIVGTYGPGSNSVSVADLALGFMLELTRKVRHFDQFTRAGQWASTASKGGFTSTISGKAVGILGLGNIGQAVARRCAGFDMTILYHQRHRNDAVPYRYVGSVTELAAASQYLIVCVPDAPETQNMIDAEALAALGPDGYLINVARGAVVDEDALVAALRSQTIAGAGLDVFRNEPKVRSDFFEFDNVVLSPHRAAFTHESTLRMRDMMMENLVAHFEGRVVPNPIPGFEVLAVESARTLAAKRAK